MIGINVNEGTGLTPAEAEAEVRRLRDAVYGPCSDGNWAACREGWMTPERVKWLREQIRLNQSTTPNEICGP